MSSFFLPGCGASSCRMRAGSLLSGSLLIYVGSGSHIKRQENVTAPFCLCLCSSVVSIMFKGSASPPALGRMETASS